MEQKKTTTYGDLKIRKAELQTEMLDADFSNFEEYKKLLVRVKQSESLSLRSISDEEKNGEIEQVKAKVYKRVKIVAIAISIAVVLAIACFGCNTIDGMRTDIHQWTDTPSHHTEK